MAQSRVFSFSFVAVVLLVLLLVSTTGSVYARDGAQVTAAAGHGGGAAFEAEARVCELQSLKFKGLCFSSTNCGNVCQTEGFLAGNCRGFRRRCFCTKHC